MKPDSIRISALRHTRCRRSQRGSSISRQVPQAGPKSDRDALDEDVKRWRGAGAVMRWTASGLVPAEQSLCHIQGYPDLPMLLTALANTLLRAPQAAP